MKNVTKMFAVFTMIMTLTVFSPTMLLAGEHGGSGMQEHGGQAVTADVVPAVDAPADDASTIKEAADALRVSNPDLAARLDKIAENM